MTWTLADIPDLTGRVALVTGANSGLGRATARELARHGAEVILAVRDEAKGREVAAATPGARLSVGVLDLADLDSVRAFAATVPTLDLLINNAGVMAPPRTLSRQGHELQFAVNHLGHFALTGLLLDRLAGDGRVVTISSLLHRRGRIRFDDLSGATDYRATAFYDQSKLANALFGLELHRRLIAAGSGVRSLLAHPGYAATNMQTSGPTGLYRAILRLATPLFAVPAERGAWPALYAATSPDALGGQFIGPGGRAELRGAPTAVSPSPAAADPALGRRLWQVSEQLTGVHFGLPALN